MTSSIAPGAAAMTMLDSVRSAMERRLPCGPCHHAGCGSGDKGRHDASLTACGHPWDRVMFMKALRRSVKVPGQTPTCSLRILREADLGSPLVTAQVSGNLS